MPYRPFAFLLLGAAAFVLFGCAKGPASEQAGAPPATYVGRQACASCHAAETDAWTGSDHDRAMQPATAGTVLGNFDDATYTYYGHTTTFFRRDRLFFVRTEGPDGTLQEYQVAFTFGVYPLQQYLIPFPKGRYQALSIAWDARPETEGGQRWFHLYPDEPITSGDVLHWTGPLQNWNYMCAECHSTNLNKNFNLAENSYETRWSEIDVSCEACHGPGSRHAAWAASYEEDAPDMPTQDDGLVVQVRPAGDTPWTIDPATGNARPHASGRGTLQIETCAHCHARRSPLFEPYTPGHSLLDTHQPALLDEGLYEADGQVSGEVYVYGSFIQSRMYRAGVACSDCHNPHTLEIKAPGNALCTSCHLATTYDTPKHHFHAEESAGAQCVNCHMPAKNFMLVDRRRDHSLRVPRPDLSVKLGTPNACNACHTDRAARWAAEAVEGWYGPDRRREHHYGEALYAGRTGSAGAAQDLIQLASDTTQPGIARATALRLLQDFPVPSSVQTAQRLLSDPDALVRLAALGTLSLLAPEDRLARVYPLLHDSVRAVRLEAANLLAPLPSHALSASQRPVLQEVLQEYIAAQQVNADQPEAHMNLGVLYAMQGQYAAAETAYRDALRVSPTYTRAYVNLADLYRLQDRDEEGERLLRGALTTAPEDAALHHALGLLLARQQRLQEAVDALKEAARLAPANLRLQYVYAIALNSTGQPGQALSVLEAAYRNHPRDRDLLAALATINRDLGNTGAALRYARELAALDPGDPAAQQLMDQLQASPGS